MALSTISIAELHAQIGKEIALSDWKIVSQDAINSFASATGDFQFIHTDPVRARDSPFGETVAHGFLVLSLIAAMSTDALPVLERFYMSVNYGLNMLRFLAPVRAETRVRARFILSDLIERSPGAWLSTMNVTLEIENETKPALVADWLTLTVLK